MIILHLGDPQPPFHHPQTVAFWKLLKKRWKPDLVIHQGDGLDLKYLKYPSPNDESARVQHDKSLAFYADVFDVFHEGMLILESNHVESRLEYAAAKAGLPDFHLKTAHELLGSPKKVQFVNRYEDEHMIAIHGHTLSGRGIDVLARNAIFTHQKSVVVGHFVLLGSKVVPTWRDTHFFMATGCMVDINSYGMKFLRDKNIPVPLGAGVTIHGKEAITQRYIP